MFNFFKKKETTENNNTLVCPIDGKTIPLSKVPDQVFAEKMAGDGIAIDTTGDTVVAPADGELTLVFKTKHAFAITLSNGIELLVHIGLDTVSLKGEGFEQLAQQGDKVKAGQPIIKIDRNFIKEKGFSLITPVLITNVDKVSEIKPFENIDAKSGETVVAEYTLA
ncbi:PTS glucose transporter subunit IIA [Clostridium sp. BJN0001]|uniref:PTS sugar transporter subunit IIA n=1 Tax=Clostridium sp. BJN0001 TaxID=2930219 RepID=UPI001FD11D6A|nr:PTS glucose transporter subunit IIA [Clostridium sp. BJN0001]